MYRQVLGYLKYLWASLQHNQPQYIGTFLLTNGKMMELPFQKKRAELTNKGERRNKTIKEQQRRTGRGGRKNTLRTTARANCED